jgi:hypothetical protein
VNSQKISERQYQIPILDKIPSQFNPCAILEAEYILIFFISGHFCACFNPTMSFLLFTTQDFITKQLLIPRSTPGSEGSPLINSPAVFLILKPHVTTHNARTATVELLWASLTETYGGKQMKEPAPAAFNLE